MKSGLPSASSAMRSRTAAGASSASSRSCVVQVGQGLERQRRLRPRDPLRPPLGQLRPGEAEQQHRRGAEPDGEVLDQVEQRLLGPVDVVEDRERAAARGRAPRTGSASRRRPRSSSLRARSRRGRPAGTPRGSARTSSPRRTAGSSRRRRSASPSSGAERARAPAGTCRCRSRRRSSRGGRPTRRPRA